MPDSLRTRIAAAIYTELREQSDRDTAFPVMVGPAIGSPNFNGVAFIDGEVDLDAAGDAVIRALGLRPERWKTDDPRSLRGDWTRWVTEWRHPHA